MILLDSDHLSIWIDDRNRLYRTLFTRLTDAEDAIRIPVVVVEEQVRGWLAQIHRARDVYRQVIPYDRLIRLTRFLCDWDIEPWNTKTADQFEALRHSRIRIGTRDLKIASIALVADALLLSANLRDFEQVPGLKVEDWLH